MDGDHDSAMQSAGWGTDEDYGHYGDDIVKAIGIVTGKQIGRAHV